MHHHFSSVTRSCLTLCDPLDCSTPGLPVHHQLLELAQTHVHRVGDAVQPSHPLSAPLPPAFALSQHQGPFEWVRDRSNIGWDFADCLRMKHKATTTRRALSWFQSPQAPVPLKASARLPFLPASSWPQLAGIRLFLLSGKPFAQEPRERKCFPLKPG